MRSRSGISLSIIVAVAANGVIGRDGGLPWRLGTDLRRFKALTMGRPMIMGRLTWESIGRPLPGRDSVVLTARAGWSAPGAAVARSWDEAKALAAELASRRGASEAAVIGGAALFGLALPEADVLHLTRVHAEPAGDVLMPSWPAHVFREAFREEHRAGPADDHPFTFIDMVRVPTPARDAALR